MKPYLVAYHTCESMELAKTIGGSLLKEGLIACVSLIPNVTSLYTWGGKMEESKEVLLMMKTHRDKKQPLERAIKQLSSYEVPEILFVEVESGYAPYLQWVDRSLKV